MCFNSIMWNLVVSCGCSRSVGVFIVLLLIIILKKGNQLLLHLQIGEGLLYIYTKQIKYRTKMFGLTRDIFRTIERTLI